MEEETKQANVHPLEASESEKRFAALSFAIQKKRWFDDAEEIVNSAELYLEFLRGE